MLSNDSAIPTHHEQLKFLKHIQQVLQSGTFTSTYKFALLISLTRLAIEQGKDSGESLQLNYLDIAEKFIDLYWKQSAPFQFNQFSMSLLFCSKVVDDKLPLLTSFIKHNSNLKRLHQREKILFFGLN